jgi:hypothetical protein
MQRSITLAGFGCLLAWLAEAPASAGSPETPSVRPPAGVAWLIASGEFGILADSAAYLILVDGRPATEYPALDCTLERVGGKSTWSAVGYGYEHRCRAAAPADASTAPPNALAKAVAVPPGEHTIVLARQSAYNRELEEQSPSAFVEQTELTFTAVGGHGYAAVTTWWNGRYWMFVRDLSNGVVVAGDAPPG